MGFRSEVREFIAEVRNYNSSEQATRKILLDIIELQQNHIDDLHRKLLARNLPELTEFTLPKETVEKIPYKSINDDALAGIIGDFGKES